MKIICHRGLWKTQKQQNQLDACLKAAKEFDGLEIDLKNRNGQIVLSHDPITSKESPIELVDLLKELKKIKVEPMIAFNIKEDGLGPNLKTIIDRFKCRDYFCFDLSRPEELKYQSIGLKVFQRFGDNDPWQKNHSFSEGLVIDVYSPENLAKILKKLKW